MIFDNKNKKNGIKRIASAFINTSKGLLWMSSNEAAFRQEVTLFSLMAIGSLFLEVTTVERLLLISSLLLVLLTETLNTAIEAVVDRIGLELHELSGLAKDLGSAAVFISLVMVVMTWSAILCF